MRRVPGERSNAVVYHVVHKAYELVPCCGKPVVGSSLFAVGTCGALSRIDIRLRSAELAVHKIIISFFVEKFRVVSDTGNGNPERNGIIFARAVIIEAFRIAFKHSIFYGLSCVITRFGSHIAVCVEVFLVYGVGDIRKIITSCIFRVVTLIEEVKHVFARKHRSIERTGFKFLFFFIRHYRYALFSFFIRFIFYVFREILCHFVEIHRAETCVEYSHVERSLRRKLFARRLFLGLARRILFGVSDAALARRSHCQSGSDSQCSRSQFFE